MLTGLAIVKKGEFRDDYGFSFDLVFRFIFLDFFVGVGIVYRAIRK